MVLRHKSRSELVFFVLIRYVDDNVFSWDRIGGPWPALDQAKRYAKKMALANSNKFMVVKEVYTAELVTRESALEESGP